VASILAGIVRTVTTVIAEAFSVTPLPYVPVHAQRQRRCTCANLNQTGGAGLLENHREHWPNLRGSVGSISKSSNRFPQIEKSSENPLFSMVV